MNLNGFKNKIIQGIGIAVTFLTVVNCSSVPKAPEKLEKVSNTQVDDKNEQFGVRDDKILIQKKVYLEEQLWKMKSEVDDLQRIIYGESRQNPGGLWESIKDCRKRLADPRIGGSGKPEAQEKWVLITEKDEEFFYQLDKKTNNFIGVSEEALDERLARYKKHQRILQDQYEGYKDKVEACESKYQTSLVQHGLNPNDTKASGEWVEGPKGYKIWKMKRGTTQDPEELMKRKLQTQEKETSEE